MFWQSIQVSDDVKVLTINGCPAVHVGNNVYVPKCDKE